MPVTGIAHGDLDGVRSVEQCGHTDPSILSARPVERIHAVEDEVEKHLLKMHAVATHARQITWHVDVQLHVPSGGVGPHETCDIANEFAHIERPRIEVLPLEQPAHPVDYGARTLVVLADVGEDRADLVEVGRFILHEKLRSLRVAQDRAERLINLMRQRRGELAHHRDAADVSDLLPQDLCVQFGLFVRSDIAGGAAYPDWLAFGVKFDTAMGRDPAYSAIRQHHPEFRLVSTFARDRYPKNLSEAFAIVGVQPLQNGIEF